MLDSRIATRNVPKRRVQKAFVADPDGYVLALIS